MVAGPGLVPRRRPGRRRCRRCGREAGPAGRETESGGSVQSRGGLARETWFPPRRNRYAPPMPFGIGIWELLILLLVLLLVFGPKRLPEMGRQLGKGMREFK